MKMSSCMKYMQLHPYLDLFPSFFAVIKIYGPSDFFCHQYSLLHISLFFRNYYTFDKTTLYIVR